MNEKIHIGKIIKEKLKEFGHSVTWLAKEINCNRTNVYKIFNKSSIDTHQLVRISLALRHDFFLYYSDFLKSLE